MVSKGAFGEYDAGAAAFASAMAQAPHKLIRRDCSSCSADTAKTVFYKRLTPLPAYDLLDVLKSNWTLHARAWWYIAAQLALVIIMTVVSLDGRSVPLYHSVTQHWGSAFCFCLLNLILADRSAKAVARGFRDAT